MTNHELNIFNYDNFRNYLRDYYNAAKARDRKFSFRFFSRVAGFQSSAVLKQVIDGKRNVAEESIAKFVKALKLNNEEAFYFRHLVLLNQARTVEEKQLHAQEILRSKAYREVHPLHAYQFNYFAHWYFVPIREMAGIDGFKEDPNWIARHLSPPIHPQEAEKALRELQKLGLLKRVKGKLVQSEPHLTTGDEVSLSSAALYHREMMKRASEAIDTVSRDKRELSAITLGMSPETAKKVKEMIQEFRKKIVEFISQDGTPSSVYHINLHLFPLMKEGKADE